MNKVLYCAGLVLSLCMACQQNKVKNPVSSPIKEAIVSKKPTVDSLVFQDKMIRIYKIDSISFFKEQQQADYRRDTIASISDVKVARKLLQGRVK